MLTQPNSNTPVSIQGYVTDPKLVGYQILTNYENHFWRPLVGNNDAWGLYEVLRSFCHEKENTCYPSIAYLTEILGLGGKQVLIGRKKIVNGKTYNFPGLIEILQQHGLIIAEVVGEAPQTRYVFHVNLNPGLLSDEQTRKLTPLMQKKHQELLERCEEQQKKLEAKRRPPKYVPDEKVYLPKEGEKEKNGEPQGGVGISYGGVGKVNGGGRKFLPEQYPYNNTHITTTVAATNNNNSSGIEDPPNSPNGDVVVVLIERGVSEKAAQRLVSRYNRGRILEKVAFHDFLKQNQAEKVKNSGAWLRKAIEDDYNKPEGFKTQAEVEAEKAANQKRESLAKQRLAEQEAAYQELIKHRQQVTINNLDDLRQHYGTTDQEQEVWKQVLQTLKSQLPSATYQGFLAPIELLSLQDGQAVLGMPNGWVLSQVEQKYTKRIGDALTSHLATRPKLQLITYNENAEPRHGTRVIEENPITDPLILIDSQQVSTNFVV